jgi:hypothetical protein
MGVDGVVGEEEEERSNKRHTPGHNVEDMLCRNTDRETERERRGGGVHTGKVIPSSYATGVSRTIVGLVRRITCRPPNGIRSSTRARHSVWEVERRTEKSGAGCRRPCDSLTTPPSSFLFPPTLVRAYPQGRR